MFFYKAIFKVITKKEKDLFELFITAGKIGKTLSIIKDFAFSNKNIRYISFSHNFFKDTVIILNTATSTGAYLTLL